MSKIITVNTQDLNECVNNGDVTAFNFKEVGTEKAGA